MQRTRRTTRSKRAASMMAILGLTASAIVGFGGVNPATADEHDDVSLTDYVNTFIGTKDDGNTYPGAAMPFGMIQLSPDNGHMVGYEYGNSRIRGFSLVHISGVGCGLGGLLPVLPTTGNLTTTRNQDYALGYNHDNEEASPGYYRVGLNSPQGTINAELTATDRTGVQRYTFPENSDAKVLINPGQALNRVTASSINIIDEYTIETEITSRGFCQDTQPFTVFTRTTFDQPFETHGTWIGDTITDGSDSASGERTGAYVTFDTSDNQTVEAVTSLSYVDAEGALKNHEAEEASFDDARAAADAAWEERLRTILVPLDDEDEARVFYSALYRSFLAPNNGTDVDGRYRGWDGEIAQVDDGRTYYQTFSLWDTYRTQQQLMFLLAPEESRDMALSMLDQAERYGWVPRWGYGPVETNIMTGDPGTAWMVSAYKQGLFEGHEERAYAVLKHNADNMPEASHPANGRAGNPEYLEYGYVPHQPNENGQPGDYDLHHGASATMEYALSDALLATMARDLGYEEDAERYAVRGQNYRAIFDVTTDNFRPRDRSGAFVGNPDPAWTEGFHEGTASQYTWLVPHDVPGLIDLLGGEENTIERLDYFFAYEDLLIAPEDTARNKWVDGTYDYYGQDTYNPNNEPDLHAPFMYSWVGQPWKTTDVTRAARTLFTDEPNGVTGNDDLGTMSSWYVFASIGIYPSIPGDDVWALSTPAFDEIEIKLDENFFGQDSLTLEAPGLTDSARYIQSVNRANGGAVADSYLRGTELTDSGTITFTVGATPSAWATSIDNAPAALNGPVEIPTRVMVSPSSGVAVVEPEGTTTFDLQVIVQGEGETQGTISVEGSGGVIATVDSSDWSVSSDGLPVSSTLSITLEAAEGYISGRFPVTVVISGADGNSITHTVIAAIGDEPWVTSDHFNNVGIGDRGEANANFDDLGYYLLRDLLATGGFVQGAANTVPGTELVYVLQEPAPGEPDNVRANGQVIDVPASQEQVTALSLVGSSNGSTQTGTLQLTYTDGTSDSVSVSLSDWCTPDPAPGNIIVSKPGARGDGTGTQNIGCGIYSTAPIEIPEGKTLASITLPNANNMHVFAIATEVANPEVVTVSASPAADEIELGESVELTATIEPATAEGEIVVSDPATGDEIGRADIVDGVAALTVTPGEEGTFEYAFAYVPANATLFVPVQDAAVASVIVSPQDEGPGDDDDDGDGDNGDGSDDGTDDDGDGDNGDGSDDGTDDDGDGDNGDGSDDGTDDDGDGDNGDGSDDGTDDDGMPATGASGILVIGLLAILGLGAGTYLTLHMRRTA